MQHLPPYNQPQLQHPDYYYDEEEEIEVGEEETDKEEEEDYLRDFFGVNDYDDEEEYEIEIIKSCQFSIEDTKQYENKDVLPEQLHLHCHENNDDVYNRLCILKTLDNINNSANDNNNDVNNNNYPNNNQNGEDNINQKYALKILRLIHGLPESFKIRCEFKSGPLFSIKIQQLRDILRATFQLNISEGQNFNFTESDDKNLSKFLALGSLSLFQDSHLVPKQELYMTTIANDIPIEPNNNSISEETTRNLTCFICYNIMTDPTTLPCGHSGCLNCFRMAFQSSPLCSYCQRPIPEDIRISLKVSIQLRDTIRSLFTDENGRTGRRERTTQEKEELSKIPILLTENELLIISHLDPIRNRRNKYDHFEKIANNLMSQLEAKSQRIYSNNNIKNLTRDRIRLLLRRSGVVAENRLIYDKIRVITKTYLEKLTKKISSVQSSVRSNVVVVDHVTGLKPLKKTMLGYGGSYGIRHVWSDGIVRLLKQIHPEMSIDPKGLSVMNDICTFIMTMILESTVEVIKCRPPDGRDPEKDYEMPATHYKEFNAGPLGPQDNSYTVRLYYEENQEMEGCLEEDDGYIALEQPLSYILVRDIQKAVADLFSSNINPHATAEGCKSLTRFNKSSSQNESIRIASDLQIDPIQVARLADIATHGCPMCVEAVVYLTAVMEYISAEVLELAGKSAKEFRLSFIDSRHIMLAIRGDEDLDELFSNCEFRDSGVVSRIEPNIYKKVNYLQPDGLTVFEESLVAKAKAAGPPYCFIDPRTGMHVYVSTTNGVEELLPAPFLDAMCDENIMTRLILARSTMSTEEKNLMKSEGSLLVDELPENNNNNDDNDINIPWGRISLKTLYFRNLADIKFMQSTTTKVFEPIGFASLVREHFNGYTKFTAEAMDCIQSYTESYLVDLFRTANKSAISNDKYVLSSYDLDLIIGIRGDRL